jgi:hypothetical protein
MKKKIALLIVIALCSSFALPLLAQGKGKGKKESAQAGQTGQEHEKHAKKKGSTEGKKKGQ